MARTIGRRWPKSAPRGDYTAMCDICGVHWRRSQMRRDRAGWLRCPDDSAGRDPVTLDQGNAEGAASYGNRRATADGGNFQGGTDE